MKHTQLTLCELPDPNLPRHESYSPFCLKAHRSLKLAGLSYTRRYNSNPGSYKSLNPSGQVPILLVDDRPVPDSTAILHEISKLSGYDFAPGTSRERGETWLWEELGDSVANAYLVSARWADERNWNTVRSVYFANMPAVIRSVVPAMLRRGVVKGLHAREVMRKGSEACWSSFQTFLDRLEDRAPDHAYWMGSSITAADISLFAQLHSFRTALTPWQHEQVNARPNLRAWLDRVDDATITTSVPSTAPVASRDSVARDAQS